MSHAERLDGGVTSIAVDTNGNGVYDDGVDEILTGPETTTELAADEGEAVEADRTVGSGEQSCQEGGGV